MDKDYQKAVKEAFFHYYKNGLIYRGERVINWCPRCQTSLSDLEVEYQEEKSKLWYIKYQLAKTGGRGPKIYIIVATTRPETMLGDAAVAVNPRDSRYKDFIGKKAILPLTGREIPIIGDKAIDQKFGTGAVKITPAHDLNDYEIGKRHGLGEIKIIDEKGKINKNAPFSYQGLSVLEARVKIVEDLKNQGLLEKEEDYNVSRPRCYRCKTTLEIILSDQWFLKMDRLAKMAIKAVKEGKVEFVPKKWEKIYFNWLKNIKDWCISRQIWWGHKIPLIGVEDVLDTWFSSSLWPFATLGWPPSSKKKASLALKRRASKSDLKVFYPTDVLTTDRDIINLWVARMIFSGLEFMKKASFKHVYIHATVLTREGKRMSKSLGTGIDPLELIQKYGADSTRFGISWQIMGGQDIRFVEETMIMGQKFCNKIWNASRFVLGQVGNKKIKVEEKRLKSLKNLTLVDKRIIKSLKETINSVDKDLNDFRFGQASRRVYKFFWEDFCSRYIEQSKHQLAIFNTKKEREKTKIILLSVLFASLKILHPFIPFLTEEIYQNLPIINKKKSLIIENWPIF
jgi:valyl-tRNA synthetase